MGPLPGCASEHVEDAATALARVIDDRGARTAADGEAIPGLTAGTGEPIGVEQIEEFLSASLRVHQIDDWEVHAIGSEEEGCLSTEWREEQIRKGLERADHLICYMSPTRFPFGLTGPQPFIDVVLFAVVGVAYVLESRWMQRNSKAGLQ